MIRRNISKRPRGRPRNDSTDRPSADGILDAAERLFAKRGFGNTSLRGLIQASRMSTTAFYARFGSKDEVLAQLLFRLMSSVGEAFLAVHHHSETLFDGFDAGVDLFVDALLHHKDVARVALSEGAANETVRQSLWDGYDRLAQALERRLDDDIDGKTRTAVSWALVGALQIHVQRWAVFDDLGADDLRASLRASGHALLDCFA